MKKLLLSTLAVLLIGTSATAQEPTLVIENGRVIVGDGPVLEQASVVVGGNRILSVTEESVEVPEARRIDASGKTVLPGLIDAHVHLGLRNPDSTSLVTLLDGPIQEVLSSFLDRGVTTVRSTGGFWPWEGELRDRLAGGGVSGPRLVTSGPVLTMRGDHPATSVCSPENTVSRATLTREVSGPAEARNAVRGLAAEDVDFIKFVSDSVNFPVPIDDATVEAIVAESHRHGLKATAHVALEEDMRDYAEMGVDGFVHTPVEPVPRHSPQRLGLILAKYGTPVTTSLSPALFFGTVEPVLQGDSPRREELELEAEHIATLVELGMPMNVGTDWRPGYDQPALQPEAMTVTEMKILRWGGMPPEAIIQAATANAAQALEMSDRIGTVEERKLADLIIVEGNPLDDLSALERVEVVLQDGEVVVDHR